MEIFLIAVITVALLAPWHHNPPTIWLFQQLDHDNFKFNIKTPHYWPYLRRIYLWPVDSTQEEPVVRKASHLIFHVMRCAHNEVIKWKHFQRYWPFVRRIHRSPVNSPHKGQWRGALMFSLIWAWINSWANNREAGDLRRYSTHYDVTVMGCVARFHYNDVIVSVIGSQNTSVSVVYSTVCSGTDQWKHQTSASLAFVRGIHRTKSQ